MLLYSFSVSVDGYITDRDGGIGWAPPPSDELFAFHLARVRELDAHLCGRRLYEVMLPWETDAAMRSTELMAEFADVWSALPKVVFSHTLTGVEGNARLAERSLADEAAGVADLEVEVGGAELAAQAIRLGLVDEFRIFRMPVVLGGGTRHLPDLDGAIALELVETRTFDGQVVYERYRRRR